ncbi:hypothetical protein C8Q80DRAFT_947486 [Daedaleopsis nitida]|nr:hypothetical protein C8Q80DRAFT_947486 [Daedaleopsis nitida]
MDHAPSSTRVSSLLLLTCTGRVSILSRPIMHKSLSAEDVCHLLESCPLSKPGARQYAGNVAHEASRPRFILQVHCARYLYLPFSYLCLCYAISTHSTVRSLSYSLYSSRPLPPRSSLSIRLVARVMEHSGEHRLARPMRPIHYKSVPLGQYSPRVWTPLGMILHL